MISKRYEEERDFLFYSEINRMSITTEQGIKLVNEVGEEMSYRKIYDFFHTIIVKEYERRMDETNEKQSS